MSNPTNISESSNIVITPSEKSVEMTWNTSTSSGIGATFYYSRIDVTDYDYLVYDLVTGDSYDSLHPGSENPIRDLGIGLCSSMPSTWAYAPNVNWTIWNRYEVTDTNRDLGTQTLDVSELSGEYYLVIAYVAWEATISNLKYATSGGNESQIKYMDKTYGISSGGEGGGSGSGVNIVKLAETNTTGFSVGNVTLSDSITNYDILIFCTNYSSQAAGFQTAAYFTDDIINRYTTDFYVVYNGAGYCDMQYVDDTTLAVLRTNGAYVHKIYGVKLDSGGGSSSHTYSTTEQVVGKWIDGSDVYEKTIVLRENGTNNFSYANDIFAQALPAGIGWIDITTLYAKRNNSGYVDCMNNQQEIILVPNPTTQEVYFHSAHSHTDVIIAIRYTKVTS